MAPDGCRHDRKKAALGVGLDLVRTLKILNTGTLVIMHYAEPATEAVERAIAERPAT